jgi:hypothetical protein
MHGQAAVLADITNLVNSIRALEIHLPTKKRMLVHALWEVAITTGNFYPRYRSQTVTQGLGHPVQRDHIFQKAHVITQLLNNPNYASEIAVDHSICCVVTRQEHTALHDVNPNLDGFDRYHAAGIVVVDMLQP